MTYIEQGGKELQFGVGIIVAKGPSVVPTSTGNLATVTGTVLITSCYAMVTTAFTAAATSLDIGTTANPTNIANVATLTSLVVGQYLASPVTPSAPVLAAAGNITWLASAGNTGQLKVYIVYVPLDAGAGIS